ncbi:hypothetical protein DFQ14_101611 [Halopolyspora algeriensis]|uniref:Uncharacterized protein n=1 Tax=Halopolyspora algeriensis TaxID=1500506 RepID=A0A368W0V4_9ACTN|nr:hypothetical protein [Halopolyspora algeriensis]RCW47262.1 hypothetical protein DFQ14_101611 [Halopolyspora algeriensis]TQM42498.1 hypothetical protein FHU43_4129 [Halopolyspora algeriensis]
MTAIPERAATDNTVRLCTTRIQPSLELPASVGTLAEFAMEPLGWPGSVLAPMKLMGRRVVPVAELLPDAHAERLCVGSAPVLDRAEVATWVWPEMVDRVPPPAARVTGVLAPARHWRSALTAAVPFARFTNAAIVVPRSVSDGRDFVSACLIRARQFGVAVLSADAESVRVELEGRSFEDAPPAEPTAVSRWVSEVAYDRLLACEAPAPSHS